MKTAFISALATIALLAGCQQAPQPASRSDAAGNTITEWPIPAGKGAAEPDLFRTADGGLLLSWVKPFDQRRHELQFTSFGRNGQWQWAPKTIAVGASMVVNWADTPHIAATGDGALWAHWLQKTRSADAADDAGRSYDVFMTRSGDGGTTWSPPIRPHNDGRAVEHGFVSFWPAARDRIGVAWITGGDLANGSMASLHSATVDATPRVDDARTIDDSVCDCCGTAVAMTARGPLLVYRDRTEDEIRDVYATRLDGDAWTAPHPVHADNWRIAACPVNGPAVAADGDNAVVAWYSAANDAPLLEIAHSADAGDSFAAPVVVDQGAAVQGRAAVALDGAQAWVAWLREDAQGQSLWLARYAPDLSKELSRTEIAKLQGRGRGTGFPKLAARDGEAFLVWTDIANGVPQLHGVRVRHR